MKIVQKTKLGKLMHGEASELAGLEGGVEGGVQLIFTSPPYKPEGFTSTTGYMTWLRDQFEPLSRLLKPDGSAVVVLGSDWNPPFQRVSPFLALSELSKILPICQQFVVMHSVSSSGFELSESVSAKVDALVDSGQRCDDRIEYAWWYGKHPKARFGFEDNVVEAWSNLHDVGDRSMKVSVPQYFIDALTDEGDLVLDPFAGSNSTGVAAETLNRRWISVEKNLETCTKAAHRLTESAQ